MTWIIAVSDRTGRLLDELADTSYLPDADLEVVRLPEGAPLADDETDADVLVVGPRELTAAGLRRVAAWLEGHPDAVALAHVEPAMKTPPSTAQLRAAGIDRWFSASPAALSKRLPVALTALAAERPKLPDAQGGGKGIRADPDLIQTGPESGPLFGRPASVRDGAPAAAPHTDDDVAFVITVASASGGSGKTFYAANLAAFLASLGHRTLLIDLDLQFGEVGAALQIKHPYSIYDGLYDAGGNPLPGDALDRHLHELVHRSELGFDVLLAPRDPTIGDTITAEDIELVISVTTLQYDVVLVDTPPALTETVLSVLDRSDIVAVLSTLDVPSLRNLTSFLDVLKRIDVGRDRVRLLLNKVESDIGIDVGQAQEAFGGRFIATLPASKGASRSINTGTVIMRSEPKSPLGKALLTSMRAVLPPELLPAGAGSDAAPAAHADAPVEPQTRGSLRSLLRARRSAPGGNK